MLVSKARFSLLYHIFCYAFNMCYVYRSFPFEMKSDGTITSGSLRLFASARSAGSVIPSPYGDLIVETFTIEAAQQCKFIFLAVSGEFALENARAICASGSTIVIDNSSAFRYMDEYPLVVPEINPHVLRGATLIANPNCTTAIAAVVLWPLHQRFKIKRLIISTYQAASGAGAEGMEELLSGTKEKLITGVQSSNSVFVHPLPFNLIPHIDKFQPNGYTKEEMKVVWETRKIFGLGEEIVISCTAVRIPILRAHSEAITIETELPITPEEARELLITAPGVRLVDDPSQNLYPMPMNATESFDVEAGRIRQSLVFGTHGLDLFVSGDQLLRGAALNAVLIAQKIMEMN
jgi:aspartate-semialdehyde dehydrogenase